MDNSWLRLLFASLVLALAIEQGTTRTIYRSEQLDAGVQEENQFTPIDNNDINSRYYRRSDVHDNEKETELPLYRYSSIPSAPSYGNYESLQDESTSDNGEDTEDNSSGNESEESNTNTLPASEMKNQEDSTLSRDNNKSNSGNHLENPNKDIEDYAAENSSDFDGMASGGDVSKDGESVGTLGNKGEDTLNKNKELGKIEEDIFNGEVKAQTKQDEEEIYQSDTERNKLRNVKLTTHMSDAKKFGTNKEKNKTQISDKISKSESNGKNKDEFKGNTYDLSQIKGKGKQFHRAKMQEDEGSGMQSTIHRKNSYKEHKVDDADISESGDQEEAPGTTDSKSMKKLDNDNSIKDRTNQGRENQASTINRKGKHHEDDDEEYIDESSGESSGDFQPVDVNADLAENNRINTVQKAKMEESKEVEDEGSNVDSTDKTDNQEKDATVNVALSKSKGMDALKKSTKDNNVNEDEHTNEDSEIKDDMQKITDQTNTQPNEVNDGENIEGKDSKVNKLPEKLHVQANTKSSDHEKDKKLKSSEESTENEDKDHASNQRNNEGKNSAFVISAKGQSDEEREKGSGLILTNEKETSGSRSKASVDIGFNGETDVGNNGNSVSKELPGNIGSSVSKSQSKESEEMDDTDSINATNDNNESVDDEDDSSTASAPYDDSNDDQQEEEEEEEEDTDNRSNAVNEGLQKNSNKSINPIDGGGDNRLKTNLFQHKNGSVVIGIDDKMKETGVADKTSKAAQNITSAHLKPLSQSELGKMEEDIFNGEVKAPNKQDEEEIYQTDTENKKLRKLNLKHDSAKQLANNTGRNAERNKDKVNISSDNASKEDKNNDGSDDKSNAAETNSEKSGSDNIEDVEFISGSGQGQNNQLEVPSSGIPSKDVKVHAIRYGEDLKNTKEKDGAKNNTDKYRDQGARTSSSREVENKVKQKTFNTDNENISKTDNEDAQRGSIDSSTTENDQEKNGEKIQKIDNYDEKENSDDDNTDMSTTSVSEQQQDVSSTHPSPSTNRIDEESTSDQEGSGSYDNNEINTSSRNDNIELGKMEEDIFNGEVKAQNKQDEEEIYQSDTERKKLRNLNLKHDSATQLSNNTGRNAERNKDKVNISSDNASKEDKNNDGSDDKSNETETNSERSGNDNIEDEELISGSGQGQSKQPAAPGAPIKTSSRNNNIETNFTSRNHQDVSKLESTSTSDTTTKNKQSNSENNENNAHNESEVSSGSGHSQEIAITRNGQSKDEDDDDDDDDDDNGETNEEISKTDSISPTSTTTEVTQSKSEDEDKDDDENDTTTDTEESTGNKQELEKKESTSTVTSTTYDAQHESEDDGNSDIGSTKIKIIPGSGHVQETEKGESTFNPTSNASKSNNRDEVNDDNEENATNDNSETEVSQGSGYDQESSKAKSSSPANPTSKDAQSNSQDVENEGIEENDTYDNSKTDSSQGSGHDQESTKVKSSSVANSISKDAQSNSEDVENEGNEENATYDNSETDVSQGSVYNQESSKAKSSSAANPTSKDAQSNSEDVENEGIEENDTYDNSKTDSSQGSGHDQESTKAKSSSAANSTSKDAQSNSEDAENEGIEENDTYDNSKTDSSQGSGHDQESTKAKSSSAANSTSKDAQSNSEDVENEGNEENATYDNSETDVSQGSGHDQKTTKAKSSSPANPTSKDTQSNSEDAGNEGNEENATYDNSITDSSQGSGHDQESTKEKSSSAANSTSKDAQSNSEDVENEGNEKNAIYDNSETDVSQGSGHDQETTSKDAQSNSEDAENDGSEENATFDNNKTDSFQGSGRDQESTKVKSSSAANSTSKDAQSKSRDEDKGYNKENTDETDSFLGSGHDVSQGSGNDQEITKAKSSSANFNLKHTQGKSRDEDAKANSTNDSVETNFPQGSGHDQEFAKGENNPAANSKDQSDSAGQKGNDEDEESATNDNTKAEVFRGSGHHQEGKFTSANNPISNVAQSKIGGEDNNGSEENTNNDDVETNSSLGSGPNQEITKEKSPSATITTSNAGQRKNVEEDSDGNERDSEDNINKTDVSPASGFLHEIKNPKSTPQEITTAKDLQSKSDAEHDEEDNDDNDDDDDDNDVDDDDDDDDDEIEGSSNNNAVETAQTSKVQSASTTNKTIEKDNMDMEKSKNSTNKKYDSSGSGQKEESFMSSSITGVKQSGSDAQSKHIENVIDINHTRDEDNEEDEDTENNDEQKATNSMAPSAKPTDDHQHNGKDEEDNTEHQSSANDESNELAKNNNSYTVNTSTPSSGIFNSTSQPKSNDLKGDNNERSDGKEINKEQMLDKVIKSRQEGYDKEGVVSDKTTHKHGEDVLVHTKKKKERTNDKGGNPQEVTGEEDVVNTKAHEEIGSTIGNEEENENDMNNSKRKDEKMNNSKKQNGEDSENNDNEERVKEEKSKAESDGEETINNVNEEASTTSKSSSSATIENEHNFSESGENDKKWDYSGEEDATRNDNHEEIKAAETSTPSLTSKDEQREENGVNSGESPDNESDEKDERNEDEENNSLQEESTATTTKTPTTTATATVQDGQRIQKFNQEASKDSLPKIQNTELKPKAAEIANIKNDNDSSVNISVVASNKHELSTANTIIPTVSTNMKDEVVDDDDDDDDDLIDENQEANNIPPDSTTNMENNKGNDERNHSRTDGDANRVSEREKTSVITEPVGSTILTSENKEKEGSHNDDNDNDDDDDKFGQMNTEITQSTNKELDEDVNGNPMNKNDEENVSNGFSGELNENKDATEQVDVVKRKYSLKPIKSKHDHSEETEENSSNYSGDVEISSSGSGGESGSSKADGEGTDAVGSALAANEGVNPLNSIKSTGTPSKPPELNSKFNFEVEKENSNSTISSSKSLKAQEFNKKGNLTGTTKHPSLKPSENADLGNNEEEIFNGEIMAQNKQDEEEIHQPDNFHRKLRKLGTKENATSKPKNNYAKNTKKESNIKEKNNDLQNMNRKNVFSKNKLGKKQHKMKRNNSISAKALQSVQAIDIYKKNKAQKGTSNSINNSNTKSKQKIEPPPFDKSSKRKPKLKSNTAKTKLSQNLHLSNRKSNSNSHHPGALLLADPKFKKRLQRLKVVFRKEMPVPVIMKIRGIKRKINEKTKGKLKHKMLNVLIMPTRSKEKKIQGRFSQKMRSPNNKQRRVKQNINKNDNTNRWTNKPANESSKTIGNRKERSSKRINEKLVKGKHPSKSILKSPQDYRKTPQNHNKTKDEASKNANKAKHPIQGKDRAPVKGGVSPLSLTGLQGGKHEGQSKIQAKTASPSSSHLSSTGPQGGINKGQSNIQAKPSSSSSSPLSLPGPQGGMNKGQAKIQAKPPSPSSWMNWGRLPWYHQRPNTSVVSPGKTPYKPPTSKPANVIPQGSKQPMRVGGMPQYKAPNYYPGIYGNTLGSKTPLPSANKPKVPQTPKAQPKPYSPHPSPYIANNYQAIKYPQQGYNYNYYKYNYNNYKPQNLYPYTLYNYNRYATYNHASQPKQPMPPRYPYTAKNAAPKKTQQNFHMRPTTKYNMGYYPYLYNYGQNVWSGKSAQLRLNERPSEDSKPSPSKEKSPMIQAKPINPMTSSMPVYPYMANNLQKAYQGVDQAYQGWEHLKGETSVGSYEPSTTVQGQVAHTGLSPQLTSNPSPNSQPQIQYAYGGQALSNPSPNSQPQIQYAYGGQTLSNPSPNAQPQIQYAYGGQTPSNPSPNAQPLIQFSYGGQTPINNKPYSFQTTDPSGQYVVYHTYQMARDSNGVECTPGEDMSFQDECNPSASTQQISQPSVMQVAPNPSVAQMPSQQDVTQVPKQPSVTQETSQPTEKPKTENNAENAKPDLSKANDQAEPLYSTTPSSNSQMGFQNAVYSSPLTQGNMQNTQPTAPLYNPIQPPTRPKSPFDIRNLMQLSEENIEDVLKALDHVEHYYVTRHEQVPSRLTAAIEGASKGVLSQYGTTVELPEKTQQKFTAPTKTSTSYLNNNDEIFDPNGNTAHAQSETQDDLVSKFDIGPNASNEENANRNLPPPVSEATSKEQSGSVFQDEDLGEKNDEHIFFKEPGASKLFKGGRLQLSNILANKEQNLKLDKDQKVLQQSNNTQKVDKNPYSIKGNYQWSYPTYSMAPREEKEYLRKAYSNRIPQKTQKTPFKSQKHATENFFLEPKQAKTPLGYKRPKLIKVKIIDGLPGSLPVVPMEKNKQGYSKSPGAPEKVPEMQLDGNSTRLPANPSDAEIPTEDSIGRPDDESSRYDAGAQDNASEMPLYGDNMGTPDSPYAVDKPMEGDSRYGTGSQEEDWDTTVGRPPTNPYNVEQPIDEDETSPEEDNSNYVTDTNENAPALESLGNYISPPETPTENPGNENPYYVASINEHVPELSLDNNYVKPSKTHYTAEKTIEEDSRKLEDETSHYETDLSSFEKTKTGKPFHNLKNILKKKLALLKAKKKAQVASNIEKFLKKEPKHHYQALAKLQESFDNPDRQNGVSYFGAAPLARLLEETDEGLEKKIVSLTGKTREHVSVPTVSSAMKYAMDAPDIAATTAKPATAGPTYKHYKERTGLFGFIDKGTEKKCSSIGKTDFQATCPKGWVAHVEFCYGIFEQPERSWKEFPPKCAVHNAMLAMPKTEEQLGFLRSHLRDRGLLGREFHIGLHKRGHTWRWSDHNEVNMDSNFNDLYGEDSNDVNCGVFFKGHIRSSKCSKARSYICEIKRGMEAVRILAFGDSLTRGYYGGGKEHHPYTEKLEFLLNTDSHKCFIVDNQGKDKEFAADMTKRLNKYLQKAPSWYKWIIILGGTNDIVHDKRPPLEKNWDRVVHDVIMAHQTAHKYGFNTIVVTIPEIDCEQTPKSDCRRMHKERLYVNERLRHYAMETSAAVLSDLAWLLPRYALEAEKRLYFWESGLHMKPRGYDKMAEIIYKDIVRNMK